MLGQLCHLLLRRLDHGRFWSCTKISIEVAVDVYNPIVPARAYP